MLASPSMSMTSRSRLRELRADRRRQAEAHRAHAARGEPQPRLAEIEVLRGPHLVLADAGGDDRLALREAVDLLDHVVRLDQLAVAVVVHRVRALERPRGARATRDQSRLKPARFAVRARARRAPRGSSPTWLHCTRLTLLISDASMSKCAMRLRARRELRRHCRPRDRRSARRARSGSRSRPRRSWRRPRRACRACASTSGSRRVARRRCPSAW